MLGKDSLSGDEFNSSNYRDHKHPLNWEGVVVCWEHDWDECPKKIEVIELKMVLRKLR